MQVKKHKVVSIDYTLKGDDGQVIDSSEGGEPLSYLHGAGNIIPGLERALEGKSKGDQVQVAIAPADGGHLFPDGGAACCRERAATGAFRIVGHIVP